jgi:hypothetical protein
MDRDIRYVKINGSCYVNPRMVTMITEVVKPERLSVEVRVEGCEYPIYSQYNLERTVSLLSNG